MARHLVRKLICGFFLQPALIAIFCAFAIPAHFAQAGPEGETHEERISLGQTPDGQEAILLITKGLSGEKNKALIKAIADISEGQASFSFTIAEKDPGAKRAVAEVQALYHSEAPVIEISVPDLSQLDPKKVTRLKAAAQTLWKMPQAYSEWMSKPDNRETLWFGITRLVIGGTIVSVQAFVASEYRMPLYLAGLAGLASGGFSFFIHIGIDNYAKYFLHNTFLPRLLFEDRAASASPRRSLWDTLVYVNPSPRAEGVQVSQNSVAGRLLSGILKRPATQEEVQKWKETFLARQADVVWWKTEVIFSSILSAFFNGLGPMIEHLTDYSSNGIAWKSFIVFLAQGRLDVFFTNLYKSAKDAANGDQAKIDSLTRKKNIAILSLSIASIFTMSLALSPETETSWITGLWRDLPLYLMTSAGVGITTTHNYRNQRGWVYGIKNWISDRIGCADALTGNPGPDEKLGDEIEETGRKISDSVDKLAG